MFVCKQEVYTVETITGSPVEEWRWSRRQKISSLPTIYCTQYKCLCGPLWMRKTLHPSTYAQLGNKGQGSWFPHNITVTLVIIGTLKIHSSYFKLQTQKYQLHSPTAPPSSNSLFRRHKLRRDRFDTYKLILTKRFNLWLVNIIPSPWFFKYKIPQITSNSMFPLNNTAS